MLDLKEAYLRLDPAKPLKGEDLASYYVVRPLDPISLLAEELQIRNSPLHVLMVGQRGIGKSTELARLSQTLADKRPCYLIDLDFGLAVFSVGGVLAYIVHSVVGFHEKELSTGWFSSIKSTILASLAESAAPEEEKVAKNLSALHSLFEQIPGEMSGGRPVILLDGTERLPSESLVELLGAVRRTHCSVVMVAPPRIALGGTYSTIIGEWDRVIHLPAISVQTPAHSVDSHGASILRSIIEKRTEFGLFEPEALDLLVPASAGIHRELLTLAQQACVSARLAARTTVAASAARNVVEEKRNEFGYKLTPEDVKLLRRYAADKSIALSPKLIPLIDRDFIISYRADWTWFGIHPLLRPLLNLMPKAEAS